MEQRKRVLVSLDAMFRVPINSYKIVLYSRKSLIKLEFHLFFLLDIHLADVVNTPTQELSIPIANPSGISVVVVDPSRHTFEI